MSTLDRAVARLLPAVPKEIVRRLSSPYIAGPTLDDAVRVVRRLGAEGKMATIDVLGEEVSSAAEAEEIHAQYREVLARIDGDGLDANISVKLSGLGLRLDEGLCRSQLGSLVADARARGIFVRIDMEDSGTTDATLRLHRELRSVGRTNVGVVLQSCLRRTARDAVGLENVRLCKGIYAEPIALAHHDPDEVRASFLEALDVLFDQGSYVGVATHDEVLIDAALHRIRERGLAASEVEFQMLLGVRPERGDALVRAGQRLRIYVPFGTHWYEYSVRRLQENPKIAGYVAADALRRFRPAVRRGG